MGKILPRSACSFATTTGSSPALSYGPQSLTGEPAAIALGPAGADCAVRLEEPGTYLLLGRIHFAGNFSAGDELLYGLMDAGQELDIGRESLFKTPAAAGEWEQEFTRVYAITSPRTVYLYAYNITANRGSVIGLRTEIQWVRLN